MGSVSCLPEILPSARKSSTKTESSSSEYISFQSVSNSSPIPSATLGYAVNKSGKSPLPGVPFAASKRCWSMESESTIEVTETKTPFSLPTVELNSSIASLNGDSD